MPERIIVQESDTEQKGNTLSPKAIPEIRVSILKVKRVKPEEFWKIVKRNQRESVDVAISEWIETDGKTPIHNYGAGPCTIAYVWNRPTGRLLSGHFPTILKEEWRELIRRDLESVQKKYPMLAEGAGIQKPIKEDTHRLTRIPDDLESYENSLLMLGRTKTWAQEVGNQNIEVFLFGQNSYAFGDTPTEYAQRLISSSVEQNEVFILFSQLGLEHSHIHDFRIPGQDNIDETFYLPSAETIYHSVKSDQKNGRWWLTKNK